MENYSRKIFEKVKEDITRLIEIERERERERLVICHLLIEKNSELVIIFMFLAPKPLKKKTSYQEGLLILLPKTLSMVMEVPHTSELRRVTS
jgi:hypothetical protein